MIGLVLILGLGGFYLYNENQTLTQNNIKLEAAVEEQKQTMAIMKEQYEKQGKALMNMSRVNAQIEADKAEYLAIFSRHNLDVLALKKPGLMEKRFNDASEKVMEGLEDDTKKLNALSNPSINDQWLFSSWIQEYRNNGLLGCFNFKLEEKDLVISEAKEILDVEDVIVSIILLEDLRIQRE